MRLPTLLRVSLLRMRLLRRRLRSLQLLWRCLSWGLLRRPCLLPLHLLLRPRFLPLHRLHSRFGTLLLRPRLLPLLRADTWFRMLLLRPRHGLLPDLGLRLLSTLLRCASLRFARGAVLSSRPSGFARRGAGTASGCPRLRIVQRPDGRSRPCSLLSAAGVRCARLTRMDA